MTKKQVAESFEECFDKVRDGEVIILIWKGEVRETDRHDLEMGDEQGDEEECSNCAKLLREIKDLKETIHDVWKWGGNYDSWGFWMDSLRW